MKGCGTLRSVTSRSIALAVSVPNEHKRHDPGWIAVGLIATDRGTARVMISVGGRSCVRVSTPA